MLFSFKHFLILSLLCLVTPIEIKASKNFQEEIHERCKDIVEYESCIKLSEESAFVGLSATINQRVKIGKECIIGAGTLITKDVQDKEVYAENSSKKLPQSSSEIGNMI